MLVKIEVVLDTNTKNVGKIVKYLVGSMSELSSYTYDEEGEGEYLGSFSVAGYSYSEFKE